MNRKPGILAVVALALFTVGSIPVEAAPPPQPTDITPALTEAGVVIDRLQAFEIGGVVVIRGRAYSKESAASASVAAQKLGYLRVANLIQIVELPDDQVLARLAERVLTIHRGLDGCKFSVAAHQGVIHLAGSVQNELQKDVAVGLVRNINGCRGVQSDLHRD